MVQVEAHPYLPETELLEFCKLNEIVLLAFAPLGHGMRPGLLDDPTVGAIDLPTLPDEAMNEISQIQTRRRLHDVVKTGSPGFIPQGS